MKKYQLKVVYPVMVTRVVEVSTPIENLSVEDATELYYNGDLEIIDAYTIRDNISKNIVFEEIVIHSVKEVTDSD
jgi:hypothetical protein